MAGTEKPNLVAFCLRLRTVLQTVDAETAGEMFGEMTRIRRELEQYRAGAQTRTLDAAELVARLDRELVHLPIDERNKAVMQRTGFKRTKLYKLRQIRRPVPNGNPDPNGTLTS